MNPPSNAPAGGAPKRDVISEVIKKSGFLEDAQLRAAVRELWLERLTRGLVFRAKLKVMQAQEDAPRKTAAGQ